MEAVGEYGIAHERDFAKDEVISRDGLAIEQAVEIEMTRDDPEMVMVYDPVIEPEPEGYDATLDIASLEAAFEANNPAGFEGIDKEAQQIDREQEPENEFELELTLDNELEL